MHTSLNSHHQSQPSPNYHRYNQTRSYVSKDTDSEVVEFNEEREEEEYIYAPQRSPSTASDTATIQFLNDDRLDPNNTTRRVRRTYFKTEDDEEEIEEIHRREDRYRTEILNASVRSDGQPKDDCNNNNLQTNGRFRGQTADYSTTSTTSVAANWEPLEEARRRNQPNNQQQRRNYPPPKTQTIIRPSENTRRVIYEEEEERNSVNYKITNNQRHYNHPSTASSSSIRQTGQNMSVDYSAPDFHQARSAIDAAAKQENVRVRQVGDTTIISEHRDPYSFYWQLDQIKKKEPDPPRRQPPITDYVVDEEEIIQETTVLSPHSHDSGVNFESQYSKPLKEEVRQLPSGWEKHEDPSGFSYYWHVDSGTIQREPPRVSKRPEIPAPTPPRTPSPPIYEKHIPEPFIEQPERIIQPQVSPQPPAQPIIEEHAFKQITTKRQVENQDEEISGDLLEGDDKKSVRFVVRSLGWTEIAESDLTADRSSRAVNKAIIDLSGGSQENTPKWGNGKELIMELNDNELLLLDPETLQVVHSEKIQQIRVWGVGRDNGRDFAYVARDKNSRRFLCHVFRCDTPARAIANSLRDICKHLMLQRQTQTATPVASERSEKRIIRESSIPVPIDEVKKVIRCHFLGVTQVPRATGIDVLNEAVDRLVSQVRPEKWLLADVAIALSTITISEVGGGQIAQCRVRYLSFLGIGQDVKHCAFIMHTSSENFMCYVFHVEPSAATMAKTIEAACKLRYQKILDANIPKSHLTNNNRIRYYDY